MTRSLLAATSCSMSLLRASLDQLVHPRGEQIVHHEFMSGLQQILGHGLAMIPNPINPIFAIVYPFE